MFIVNSVAADLSILKTPGEWGADFAVGDVQSLGLPMAFGGPYAGYMSCTQKMMRKMPGRIVGQTKRFTWTTCICTYTPLYKHANNTFDAR